MLHGLSTTFLHCYVKNYYMRPVAEKNVEIVSWTMIAVSEYTVLC